MKIGTDHRTFFTVSNMFGHVRMHLDSFDGQSTYLTNFRLFVRSFVSLFVRSFGRSILVRSTLNGRKKIWALRAQNF